MTPEQQRIAIAEACGWRRKPYGDMIVWYHPTRGACPTEPRHRDAALPDYLNDLNAMHEAENVLSRHGLWYVYCDELHRIHSPDGIDRTACVHATAAQRAEAFCALLANGKDRTMSDTPGTDAVAFSNNSDQEPYCAMYTGKQQQLEAKLNAAIKRAEKAERVNAEMERQLGARWDTIDEQQKRITELQATNAELREDKGRLDAIQNLLSRLEHIKGSKWQSCDYMGYLIGSGTVRELADNAIEQKKRRDAANE
jgi:hypothetical protein